MSRPFLTIIIPAYNEAQRLPDSLTKIAEYLRNQSFATEILVVGKPFDRRDQCCRARLCSNGLRFRSIHAGTASQRAGEGVQP